MPLPNAVQYLMQKLGFGEPVVPTSQKPFAIPKPAPKPIAIDWTERAKYPAPDDFETRRAVLPLLDQYSQYIKNSAKEFDVPEPLIKAVILKESAANAKAQSNGQYGLMQIIPKFVDMTGIKDPLDPAQNIKAGTRHLAKFLHANNGNLDLALASYNAGPTLVNDLNTGKVTKRNPKGLNTKGIPLTNKVTMSYIPTVKSWMQQLATPAQK